MGRKQSEMSSSAPYVVHCPCDSRVSSPFPSVASLSSFCVISQTHASPPSAITPGMSPSPPPLSLAVHKALVPPTAPSLASALPTPPSSLHLVCRPRGPTLTSSVSAAGHLPQLCPFGVPDLSPSSSLALSSPTLSLTPAPLVSPLPAPGPAPSRPSVPRGEAVRLHGARLREALHRVLEPV